MKEIDFNPEFEKEDNSRHLDKFRKRLVILRKEKNLTQHELAVLLGFSHSKILSWENGKTVPNALQIRKISSFFSVSCDFLSGLTDFKGERISTRS